MKRAFDEEQDDTKKQITDLQYDLLELRDAHAKLRTTNEKLRRDKDKSVDDVRLAVSCFNVISACPGLLSLSIHGTDFPFRPIMSAALAAQGNLLKNF